MVLAGWTPNCNLLVMVEHNPVFLPIVSSMLEFAFVAAFIELLVWTGILTISEQNFPFMAAASARFEGALIFLARHRFFAVAGIFLLVMVGRLVALPVSPVPMPKIQDEFSQLLAADTFASGRLTNPTHPMWFYLETFFVNQKPTYHSMYPPATGLFMAAAQILTGQPWFGMLFAFAAAAAGVCWMIQGWMPARWGPWGALMFILVAARAQMPDHYLGEGIFVLGGTLIVGAIPRIVKKNSVGAAVWLGIGIALFGASRPFEGALLVSGIVLGGFYWASQTGVKAITLLKRVVLPVAMILTPVVGLLGYQNWRTTGSPLLAPYQVNLVEQHITRPMVWEKPADPPKYDHVAMASFYDQWELGWWKKTRGLARGIVLFLTDKAFTVYATIIWPLAIPVAVGFYQLLKIKTRRFLPLALTFFVVGLFIETYQLQARYTEPAWGLAILLAVYGMRYIGVWRRKTRQGLMISKAAAMLIPSAMLLIVSSLYIARASSHVEAWYTARQQLSKSLELVPGKHLILVRYSPAHYPQEEWVYNRADIDRAKIVWARDDAHQAEADLPRYFADRTVWLLDPDGKIPVVTALSGKNTAANSRVGPFRITCGNSECESLKQSLASVLTSESYIPMAEKSK
jgi:hypothetical protein